MNDAFPDEVKNRLLPHLKLVELPAGKILFDANEKENFVFFPINCIIAQTYMTQSGASSEISMVGSEGLIGLSSLLGGESTTSRSIVLSGGYAHRLPSQQLKTEFNRYAESWELILRYAQALITQVAQTAVCNRHCNLDHRLCTWLLLLLDRLEGNQLTMTQEMIANMLGVRREGVTIAAGQLQKLGIIECQRGHITVLDRAALEERCCECYFVVQKETNRLLPYLQQDETEGQEWKFPASALKAETY
ncbi:Crp/Fnr family transcriptional regulator [Nitrincola sp. MINF-07-Sa-05]|uniref:Crp/Fnr family transcriptional regulator n=1 Tax=Nitrincola salilacus TaxID=3400273 RepID=UPI003918092E